MFTSRLTPLWCAVFVCSPVLVGSLQALGAPVAIVNHSFEADDIAAGSFTSGSITGWTNGGFGLIDRNSGSFAAALEPTPDTDGEQVAWSNSGTLFQVLPTNVAPNTIYTLSVDVGDRTDTGFAVGPILLGVGGAFGTNLLPGAIINNTPVTNTGANPNDGWQTWVTTFTTGNTLAATGALRIDLSSFGTQAIIDNVRLDAQPVIPTPAALGAGLVMLGAVALRRRAR